MRRKLAGSVALLAALALTSCANDIGVPNVAETSDPPPCTDVPELVAAIDTIWDAHANTPTSPVHGEAGGRLSNVFEVLKRDNLAAMVNPKGAGVIVSVVYASGKAQARDTASRFGWLVLDGTIYPIDVEGAQAFGLLWDGYPSAIKASAGLGNDYFGLDSYGVDSIVAYNADSTSKYTQFLQAANELCDPVDALGG